MCGRARRVQRGYFAHFIKAVQARAEVFRNLAFSDLITTSSVQTLRATAANTSDFAKSATEVVKISAYRTDPTKGVTQTTRAMDGTVILNSTATILASS